MKKFYFYGMVIVCLFCTATIHAQDRYWVGTTGNWSDQANWADNPLGPGGQTVPNGAGMNAIIDRDATINVNIAGITLNRLVVTGTGTEAQLVASVGSVITVSGSTDGNEGLLVGSGATLLQTVSADVGFSITFANDALGQVDGTWHLSGIPGVDPPEGATFTFPAVATESNRLDINGTLRFSENSRRPILSAEVGSAYLHFNNGSTYHLNRNGSGTIPATWNANSTILLTGIIDLPPAFNTGTFLPQFGNLVINCPSLNNPTFETVMLGLPDNIVFQGSIEVQNTNNFPLVLTRIAMTGDASVDVTVGGNFTVSGNSEVYLADDITRSCVLSVGGNMNLTGGSFYLQRANGVGANATVVALEGSLNHTAGATFGPGSDDQGDTESFILELNGAGGQTITSTGTMDDPGNMLTLRLNTASGASLSSPASFGKISWSSAAQGILTTNTTNYLTITNPSATATTVVNSPSNNGFVSGPVRRVTNSTNTYRFPTGKGGVYRYAEVIPATTTGSTYGVEYFNTAHPNVGNVTSPLVAVSNTEWWQASRVSGSAAAVQLTLTSQFPGAGPADAIVVAQYTSSWIRTPGSPILTPGDVSSGTVRTVEMGSFNHAFTLAYGPASALPVDLVSFTAKKLSGSAALLNWEVTASSTPDRFEVMRSGDGSNFTTVGTVNAAGQQTKYSYTDNSMPAGTVYYRLRMVDVNGEVKLSKVVVLLNGSDGLFLTSMAPTIVTSRARISVTSSQRGNLQLVVTDMYGRIVQQQINGINEGSQEIWLNLHSLSRGAYQVTGYLDGKRSGSIRFIKQ